MWGISWLAENRLASQEGLFSMEWVSECMKYISYPQDCIYMHSFFEILYYSTVEMHLGVKVEKIILF
jgi:hypothetical protein